jgi:hypothetical protein
MSELRAVDTLLAAAPRLLPAWLKRLVAMLSYLLFMVLAVFEGVICCAIGNCNIWRGICLPSSNGYFTSQAVAVMYGALANGGVVEVAAGAGEGAGAATGSSSCSSEDPPPPRSVQVFSKEAVDKLFAEAADPATAVPMHALHADTASWGRHSKGFSPWPLPTLHGPDMLHTLGHQGMGGCSSFGCASSGLAVCIMRNVYDPLLVSEGAVKLDDGLLSQIIRDVLT